MGELMNSVGNFLQTPFTFFSSNLTEGNGTRGLIETVKAIALPCFYLISALYLISVLCRALSRSFTPAFSPPIAPIARKSSESIQEEFTQIAGLLPILDPRDHRESFSAAQSSQNIYKNRFQNILPNDATRVQFDEAPHFYFNANWVFNRTAIAAQGPTIATAFDFWKMVHLSRSDTIAMVTDLVEDRVQKCSLYWPDSPTDCFTFPEGLSVEMRSTSSSLEDTVRIREFVLKKDGEERIIKHLQLSGWPDQSVMDPEVLAQFVLLLKEKLKVSQGPLITHGCAGIGRTGVLLGILEAEKRIERGEFSSESIPEIFKMLRQARNGMMANPQQYELMYRTIKI